jgi:hypothetical protein
MSTDQFSRSSSSATARRDRSKTRAANRKTCGAKVVEAASSSDGGTVTPSARAVCRIVF